MTNIIPFDDTSRLPAHLKGVDVAALNAEITAHAGAGFPIVSIKGKTFTIVRDGERKIIPNPKDPESPATYIEVVVVKVNKNKSKVWYAQGYQEGTEQKKPDCYSTDGAYPAADAENKQAKSCAACKYNEWGSKVSTDGRGSKAKACADSVRIAIAMPDLVNDPYLLRVPAASMRNLGELGQQVAKRGVPYTAVITRISFDMAEATPKLQFKPVGFLDEVTFKKVQEMAESEVVKNILGSSMGYVDDAMAGGPVGKIDEPKPEPVKAAAKQAEVVISKAKSVSTEEVVGTINKVTQGTADVTSSDLGSLDLGDLNFDE